MANEEIKKMLKESKIAYWKLGAKLNVCDNTIGRWLRFPLDRETKEKLMSAVDEIQKEK